MEGTASTPASPSGIANDAGEYIGSVTTIDARPSNDDDEAVESSPTSKGNNEPPNSTTMQQQTRLRVHGEDSVAYITVSDPVQHTEGIKGKFTVYRVAYDPPLPTADAPLSSDTKTTNNDASNGTTVVNGNDNERTLFPYATSVNRRYSDFSWLFDHLHKERPGAIVPPLPEKQQASRFSESFIEDRRSHLELFLRRVVCNPELKDTECLLVFLGGGDAEFKKAKKDGSYGTAAAAGSPTSNVDATIGRTLSDDYNMNDGTENDHQNQDPTLMNKGKEILSTKKGGIKKWIKERKTSMKGTVVRSPDDAVFEEVTHFVFALEAGLKRVEAQASAMLRRDRDISASFLEFGLGCDALAHMEDEVNGSGVEDESGASGIGQTFRLVGKTADAVSAISSSHYDRELRGFHEPLREHLKMVHAVKVALMKRNNRRITYSTCLNAVDSKKASLHRYRITPGQEGKAFGVESSLSRAETAVLTARNNYDEVSARVLREVDRFRRENAAAMYATMAEFARAQKEYHDGMNEVWGALVPRLEEVDAERFNGKSFAGAAAALREGRSFVGGSGAGASGSVGGGGVEPVTTQVENMAMPSYPPPPEPMPANNGVDNSTNAMESSMLNGAVRYREPLPEE